MATLGLLAGGCAQFTTSKAEEAALLKAAQDKADYYVDCTQRIALGYPRYTPADFISDIAEQTCDGAFMEFQEAQQTYLDTQYIATGKAMRQAEEEVQQRSRRAIAAIMVNQPVSMDDADMPVAAPAAAGAVTVVPEAAAAAPADWNEQERIYLDCMADQAGKYARLNESAADIAEVAATRCSEYLVGGNTAALKQAGKSEAMALVMDQRLQMQVR